MKPKILVGGPTSHHFRYCVDEYIEALKNLSYDNYEILLVDNSKDDEYFNYIKDKVQAVKLPIYYENARERVAESKNIMREKVLNENYDYFLNLDTDTIPPKDIIERFLAHKKDIITGVYYKIFNVTIMPQNVNKEMIMPLIYTKIQDRIHQCTAEEVESPRLMQIYGCGSGCLMVSKDVLNRIKFRFDETIWDDMKLCEDAEKLNIPVFCDTSVKCMHLILKKNAKF